jgi:hypothetical protein
MFSLPAKGQKFGKVFTMIQIIMILFQLAKVSPMILQKKETEKMKNKTHQTTCNVKSIESLRHGLQIHIL